MNMSAHKEMMQLADGEDAQLGDEVPEEFGAPSVLNDDINLLLSQHTLPGLMVYKMPALLQLGFLLLPTHPRPRAGDPPQQGL
jgi:hypothetical protein